MSIVDHGVAGGGQGFGIKLGFADEDVELGYEGVGAVPGGSDADALGSRLQVARGDAGLGLEGEGVVGVEIAVLSLDAEDGGGVHLEVVLDGVAGDLAGEGAVAGGVDEDGGAGVDRPSEGHVGAHIVGVPDWGVDEVGLGEGVHDGGLAAGVAGEVEGGHLASGAEGAAADSDGAAAVGVGAEGAEGEVVGGVFRKGGEGVGGVGGGGVAEGVGALDAEDAVGGAVVGGVAPVQGDAAAGGFDNQTSRLGTGGGEGYTEVVHVSGRAILALAAENDVARAAGDGDRKLVGVPSRGAFGLNHAAIGLCVVTRDEAQLGGTFNIAIGAGEYADAFAGIAGAGSIA